MKLDLGVVADEKGIAFRLVLRRLNQVAELPVRDPQPRTFAGGPHLGQQVRDQRRIADLAVGVGGQPRHQIGPQRQGRHQLASQHVPADAPQRLQPLGNVLDLLPVDGGRLEGPQRLRQPHWAAMFGPSERLLPAAASPHKEPDRERNRHPLQLAIRGPNRRFQLLALHRLLEAAMPAAAVLQQRVADQLHQQRKADHPFVRASPVLLEHAPQEIFLRDEIQQPQRRFRQRRPLAHFLGKTFHGFLATKSDDPSSTTSHKYANINDLRKLKMFQAVGFQPAICGEYNLLNATTKMALGTNAMTQTTTGIVENGQLRLTEPLALPDRTAVSVTIEPLPAGASDALAAWERTKERLLLRPIYGGQRFTRDELYEGR